ncbi:MAG TPA: TolC family protein [Chitinophagaceae bacterium]
MRGVMLLVLMCLALTIQAQKILTENDLISVVKKFHPIAKQAALEVRIADANLTASRAGFDPVASFDNSRKDFTGITYYDHQLSQLKIPTWYGVDVYVGTETIKGERINPEETNGRIHFAGISVPLIQNILIDKRRAAVQQARILRQQSEVVRKSILNDLIADAVTAYWDWWEQYQLLKVVQASVQNAKTRLTMVKTAYRLGDRPAIDTLEAATQVQFFEQQETEIAMMLQKSRLQLSLYLWTDKEVAYELPEDVLPEAMQPDNPPQLDSLLGEAMVQPLLQEYDYKLKGLDVEKRLKFQSLLPEVRASYNAISRDFSKTFNDALFNNNYRFGLTLSMPLRLSEGRGGYRAAKLKIEQTKVAQVAKQVSVQNKVRQYYIEWQQALALYQQQQNLVRNYLALQRGEETRFSNGESSLFVVNAREAKTIEGQRKELSLAAKIQQAMVRLRWAAGVYSNF